MATLVPVPHGQHEAGDPQTQKKGTRATHARPLGIFAENAQGGIAPTKTTLLVDILYYHSYCLPTTLVSVFFLFFCSSALALHTYSALSLVSLPETTSSKSGPVDRVDTVI